MIEKVADNMIANLSFQSGYLFKQKAKV